jgi:DNA-binding transcriptional LysR family regulator
MDTLQAMKVFVRVAQRSSFAAAGRDLTMSPAAVTKHVAALEARVGARLFDRTTRRVALTESGRLYMERCIECLQAFEDADASMSELSREPKGVLRIAAPVDLGNELAPIIARLLNQHAQIKAELLLSNRPVDLVEEGIDVAVRVAATLDGRYVARPVASTRVGVFAAPAYLRSWGRPSGPEELAQHRALVFLEPRARDEWIFERNERSIRVKFNGSMTSNLGAALSTACAAGAGVLVAPSFVTRTDVAAGRIERVLPEWTVLPDLRVFAIYPHRRFLAPKVKAFVEALAAAYGDGTRDPWEPGATIRAATGVPPPQRGTGRRVAASISSTRAGR